MKGKTIQRIRPMTKSEVADFGWFERGVVIEFTDGSYLLASRDSEGNGPGALFGFDAVANKEQNFYPSK